MVSIERLERGHSMLRWIDDHHLELDGLRFRLDVSRDRPLDWDGGEIVLMKPRADLVDAYVEALAPYRGCNVVEIGVWGGGSTIFYERLLRPRKHVAIDVSDGVPQALSSHIERFGLRDVVVPCCGVDQGDRDSIRAILDREFGDEPIDVVIDDASHRYDATKASFNAIFPRLSADGTYFIEDWGWAHWRGKYQQYWMDEPALTTLVFELAMNVATWGGYMVRGVDVQHGFVAVRRGSGNLPSNFDVSSLYLSRGRRFEPI
jgi:hypothetical protein